MAMLQTVLTDGDGDEPRWRTWAKAMWTQRSQLRELYDLKHWSERTVIALVMQSLDNSITTYGKKLPVRRLADDLAPGPRRAQPDVDPGRQRGGAPHRRRARRRARRAATSASRSTCR